MENKILDLVMEVNSNQDETILEYVSTGYWEGVKLTDLYLWDDQNYSLDTIRQSVLSKLTHDLNKILNVIQPILKQELDLFFGEKIKRMEELFGTDIKLVVKNKTQTVYSAEVFGQYNEDVMDSFMDVLKEDFEYIFENFKLDCKW